MKEGGEVVVDVRNVRVGGKGEVRERRGERVDERVRSVQREREARRKNEEREESREKKAGYHSQIDATPVPFSVVVRCCCCYCCCCVVVVCLLLSL